MKNESRSVSGSRIQVLRLFHGWTQAELARRSGRSQAVIAKYEAGLFGDARTIAQIADALGVPDWFLEEPEVSVPSEEAATFRKRASATAKERGKARAALSIAAEVIEPHVSKYARRPPVDVPDLAGEDPRVAAQLLRSQWTLGVAPIGNLLWLLEAKGVCVYFITGGSKSLDALCGWSAGKPVVVLSTDKADGARARFDLAHELGHLVLHQGIGMGETDHRQLEAEADEFASSFLMPKDSFFREVPPVFSIEAYSRLRARWGVSVQAAVRRARDLARITEWQYTDAYKKMAMLGWRSGPEPGCPPRETSFVHTRVFEILGDRGITPDAFAKDVGLPLPVVLEMVPEAKKHAAPTPIDALFDDRERFDRLFR